MSLLLSLLLAASLDAFPLEIEVGKAVAVCKTGTIICPASNSICDDTTLVGVETSAEGLVFRGLKAGTTTCSAGSSAGAGMRSVYRVTVVPKKGP
jgi:hypothetical protein